MHKQVSLLIHSALIVGALLPISPLMPTLRSSSSTSPVFNPVSLTASDAQRADQLDMQLISYGRGLPRFRGGGGTR